MWRRGGKWGGFCGDGQKGQDRSGPTRAGNVAVRGVPGGQKKRADIKKAFDKTRSRLKM